MPRICVFDDTHALSCCHCIPFSRRWPIFIVAFYTAYASSHLYDYFSLLSSVPNDIGGAGVGSGAAAAIFVCIVCMAFVVLLLSLVY